MKLQLDRPLVFFDIEATGLDITNDRIVELTILKLMPDGERIVRTRRFNPEMPIPAESTAIHGITDEDVRDCPPFRACAKSLAELIDGCDLAGYNSQRFDLPMLGEEFLREHIGAHGAEADTIATLDVLLAQLEKYGDALPHSVKELSDLTTYHRNVDLAGRIVLDDNDVPVFNFGKHKGRSVETVLREEPGYLSWLLQADFSRDTKRQFLLIKEQMKP